MTPRQWDPSLFLSIPFMMSWQNWKIYGKDKLSGTLVSEIRILPLIWFQYQTWNENWDVQSFLGHHNKDWQYRWQVDGSLHMVLGEVSSPLWPTDGLGLLLRSPGWLVWSILWADQRYRDVMANMVNLDWSTVYDEQVKEGWQTHKSKLCGSSFYGSEISRISWLIWTEVY